MSNINIWKKFKKESLLSSRNFTLVYKAKNIENGNYVAIKEINKKKNKNNKFRK